MAAQCVAENVDHPQPTMRLFYGKSQRRFKRFLKAEHLGKENYSPLLVQLLAQHNQAFASIPMPMYEGNPTQREFVARVLIKS